MRGSSPWAAWRSILGGGDGDGGDGGGGDGVMVMVVMPQIYLNCHRLGCTC